MKKTIRRFTLVEMLTVVAIIGILAGLIIPTVVIAQRRGRETQAKSDISGIMTALKQLKSDYNRCLAQSGNKYHAGGVSASSSQTSTFSCSVGHSPSQSHTVIRVDGDLYDALIAELSAPKNGGLSSDMKKLVNKRKKVYLDPKNGFNPTANYNTDANKENLWRDPWGNPYVIYIGVDADHQMKMAASNSSVIATGIAVYSFGPNGEDDGGCNSSLDACISSVSGNGSSNHKNHDDIASWNF